jgi:DNA polymerase elongation subunit (family B)
MDTADKEITGISLFDCLTKTCHVFILDKDHKIDDNEKEVDPWLPKDWKITTDEEKQKVKIVTRSFDDEDNLLISFMDKWQECGFTIVTGWNVDYFDMPYLYLRLKNCLGAKAAKCLSPIGAAYVNGFTKKLMVGGISVLDYILLYKKFSGKMEPTYALGPIGQKVVGIGKVQYHGNLNDLYKADINKFLEYNITDVKIVVALDRKLKFIDLARNICHVGHVPYDNFHMSSRYLDGATLIYLRRNGGVIAPNKPSQGREEYEERLEEGEEGFSGAFVKEPVPGRYNWVFDLDLTSMYPNIIISLNISPETKIAKISNAEYSLDSQDEKRKSVLKEIESMEKKEKERLWSNETEKEEYIQRRCVEFDMEYHVRGKLDVYRLGQTNYTKDEFTKLITDSNYSLSSNGVLYRQDKLGVVPTLLALWFQQRKDMRKKAAEFKKAGDMEQYNFYNQRQQVWKILLNSFYGVLGLPVFRFYDVDNAEAVTTTGVDIIQTTAKAINIYYKQALETDEDGDWVIYSDTDSCFVNSIPIIKKRFPNIDLNNEDEMTKAIMSVTTEVQTYVNQFYNVMAKRFFNLGKHTFDAKQEVISKSSFWLAKKRYAQWIIHEEGALLKQPRLEVKGIDVVRTSFPASFRKFMDSFLRKLLTAVPKKELDDMILKFREDMKTFAVIDIAKNTSVKFVSEDGTKNYNPESRRALQFEKATPAAVKASLAYNDLLVKMGLEKQVEPIHHGQKIKWVYLQDNQYGLDALAMKGDGNDADELLDIINQYVDRKKMFEQELKSKLIDFYDVFKWTFPNSSMATAANFFDFGQ